ncbi:MAG: hypothetical protein DRQ59_14355 [Gammaproteobacteria bacterium]|nr:MAG: hypothetical protein DRQ59_14355 [Gammaproteobacteria bacterium]
MVAAASAILGLTHLLLWLKMPQPTVYLLSSLMAFSAGAGAKLESGMIFTASFHTYRILIRLAISLWRRNVNPSRCKNLNSNS